MNSAAKKKISDIIWPLVYLVLIGTICASGCLVFKRYYYCSVFISGKSMDPTLMGGNGNGDSGIAEYGLVDTSDQIKKQLKRFDIVTTYYPWDSDDYIDYQPGQTERNGHNPERKIKRLLALPGETISVSDGNITITENAKVVKDWSADTDYKLGVVPTLASDYENFYVSGLINNSASFSYNISYKSGLNLMLEDAGKAGEYFVRYETTPNAYSYLTLTKSEGKYVFRGDMTGSTVFTFCSKYDTIRTEIKDDMEDPTKNGQYVLALNEDISRLELTKVDAVRDGQKVAQICVRDDEHSVTYYDHNSTEENVEKLPFDRNFDARQKTYKDFSDVVLRDGAYWVQGDHWGNSTDCYHNGPVYYENLEGKLIVIEGTCRIKYSNGEKICDEHQAYKEPRIL